MRKRGGKCVLFSALKRGAFSVKTCVHAEFVGYVFFISFFMQVLLNGYANNRSASLA